MPPPPRRASHANVGGGGGGAAPPAATPLVPEPSDLSASALVTINSRQHRTVSALLASLQQTAARGAERLQRLERVLATIAADAAEPERVRAAYSTVSALGRELLELQRSNADFAAALEAAGTRGELAEVKRRLDGHQALLGAWEEKVRAALEDVTELQSPERRNSMLLASAPPAFRPAGGVGAAAGSSGASLLPGTAPRRSAFTPGPTYAGSGR